MNPSSNEVNTSNLASSPVSQEPASSNTQTDTTTELIPVQIQRQDASTEATLLYWENWRSLRESYAVAAEPFVSAYSVENSVTLSSLNTQIADQLEQLSAVNVDPELIEVAANAIVLYRNSAGIYQEQANLLAKWATRIKLESRYGVVFENE